ncbi:MAG: methyltransferase domain-containing protein [Planctomycetes bacterium]|nr:methyltransferase domain-containing protein [Planctomycetota bacterium]
MTQAAAPNYDRKFYENEQDSSLQSARIIAPYVYELIKPASVVDVGCGVGGWLLAFKEAGAAVIHGYDGNWVQPDMLRIPVDCFTPHDISQPIVGDRRFDLAINLEAAEHLPAEKAPGLVASLVKLTPVILFSAAIPHQEGRNHVNEQWPDYWVSLFEQHNYRAIDCLRARFWSNQDVRWWYKQNAMLMVAEARLAQDAILKALADASPSPPPPLVHPELFEEKWNKLESARRKAEKPPAGIGSGLRELRRGVTNTFRKAAGKEPR